MYLLFVIFFNFLGVILHVLMQVQITFIKVRLHRIVVPTPTLKRLFHHLPNIAMREEAIHMVIIIRINHHRHEVTRIVHHNTVTVNRVLPYPIPLTERQIREIIQPIHEQTARPTTDILFQGIERLTRLIDGHRTLYLLVDGKVTAIELQTTEPVLDAETGSLAKPCVEKLV